MHAVILEANASLRESLERQLKTRFTTVCAFDSVEYAWHELGQTDIVVLRAEVDAPALLAKLGRGSRRTAIVALTSSAAEEASLASSPAVVCVRTPLTAQRFHEAVTRAMAHVIGPAD